VAGEPVVGPRLKIGLAPVAGALERECLKDVELAIPALRVAKSESGARSLWLARVVVNRGRTHACEVPKDLWFSSDDGEVVQPPAYLAGAPAFASYLDAVAFDVPPAAARGQLFIGERRAAGTMEIVAQLRVDLDKALLTRVQDVEVRVLDPVDGAPVANADLLLRGQTDWRPDRSVVQKGKTGADGRFRFARVEPGAWTLRAKADRHLEAELKLVQGSAEATRVEVRLTTPPPAPGFIGVVLENGDDGLRVREVTRHGGADRAGIRPDDRLVSANGARLKDVQSSRPLITGAPGSFVTLEVRRGGQTLSLKVQRAAGHKD
jgi:hypothetical protein